MKHEVEIIVRGKTGSGRTTVAGIIARRLQDLGFFSVSLSDRDPNQVKRSLEGGYASRTSAVVRTAASDPFPHDSSVLSECKCQRGPDPKDVVGNHTYSLQSQLRALEAGVAIDIAKSQFTTAIAVKLCKDYERLWDAVRDFEHDTELIKLYLRLKRVCHILGVNPLDPLGANRHPVDINEARRKSPVKKEDKP